MESMLAISFPTERRNAMFAKWTLTLLCLACLPTSAFAADIVIINGDDPGEGFNDPTPAAPVGGNTGVTIGAQRLNAFIAAASIWGANISSPVTIRIVAQFDPLPCSDTSVLLGSAGPRLIVRNFPGAPFANTWYPKALANKLAGFELFSSFPDINARFNSVLGQPSCFGGIGWYYGLDNNHGALLDLVSTILHEFAHGLGMISITGSTGVLLAGSPSIYNRYMFDSTIGKTWDLMTDVERVASAINTNNLSWIGPNVLTAAPSVLSRGAPRLQINAPPNLKGDYRAGRPLFGRPLEFPSTTGELGLVIDGAGLSLTDGCEPLTGPAAQAVKNKIALVDFGNCLTKVKVKNAQDAGARGVVIVDNGVRSPHRILGPPSRRLLSPRFSSRLQTEIYLNRLSRRAGP